MSSADQQSFTWEMNPAILDQTRKFKDHYDMKEELGKGGFGTVRRCIYKAQRRELAAKINNTPDKKGAQKEESRACQKLSEGGGHLNLVNMFDTVEEGDIVYNIYELAVGGDLMEDITKNEFLTELEASNAIRQILDGVNHMHEKGYLHRDLKPHNVLIQSKNVRVYKVTDFGLARARAPNPNPTPTNRFIKASHGNAGTPGYTAPEPIYDPRTCNPTSLSEYDTDCDIWSCGVILYQMLAGYQPFWEDDANAVIAKVLAVDFTYPSPEWDNLNDAKAMISVMICGLTRNAQRGTPDRANYQALTQMAFYRLSLNNPPVQKKAESALKKFLSKRELKREILQLHWAQHPPQAPPAAPAGPAQGAPAGPPQGAQGGIPPPPP